MGSPDHRGVMANPGKRSVQNKNVLCIAVFSRCVGLLSEVRRRHEVKSCNWSM